jgi:hypothetical protein
VTAVRGSIWFTNSDGNQRLHLFSYNLNGRAIAATAAALQAATAVTYYSAAPASSIALRTTTAAAASFQTAAAVTLRAYAAAVSRVSVLVAALRFLQRC